MAEIGISKKYLVVYVGELGKFANIEPFMNRQGKNTG